MFSRPPPELIRARKWEIKRRYSSKAKVGKRTRSMAAIRLAELQRWFDDTIGAGTELQASQWGEGIARVFVHHFVVLAEGNRKAAGWLDRHASWIETRDREYMITEANHCPLKWTADKLGWKIKLTDEQRTRLKIKTIGALGISREQRAERRRQAHAERQKRLRAAKRAQHIG